MDPQTFIAILCDQIPLSVRSSLFQQCLNYSSNKHCRVELPKGKLIGILLDASFPGDITLKSNGAPSKIPVKSIVSMCTRTTAKKFKTDSEISSRQRPSRTLERWITEGQELNLESEDRNWNQFETNKKKFGVVSTYDEEIYTTKKVHENQLSREQVQRALRIEKEVALQERRDPDESYETNEEKMFGAVLGPGRFVESEEGGLEKSVVGLRERATSMASCAEFTKDEYRRTREYLMNFHRGKKESSVPVVTSLDALDLNIAQTGDEEVIINFLKFKQTKLPSRDSVLKEFREFASKIKNTGDDGRSQDGKKPNSIVDVFIGAWKGISVGN